jgi:pimeloyl-ACP methyl ester carboxylesterase
MPVILLHGYAQNSRMWRPLMKELTKTHLGVAADLRRFREVTRGRAFHYHDLVAELGGKA